MRPWIQPRVQSSCPTCMNFTLTLCHPYQWSNLASLFHTRASSPDNSEQCQRPLCQFLFNCQPFQFLQTHAATLPRQPSSARRAFCGTAFAFSPDTEKECHVYRTCTTSKLGCGASLNPARNATHTQTCFRQFCRRKLEMSLVGVPLHRSTPLGTLPSHSPPAIQRSLRKTQFGSQICDI